MDILIITSRFSILQLFIQHLNLLENLGHNYARFTYKNNELDVLISKTNGTTISYHLSKALVSGSYDLVIHLDRCFSLKDTTEPGIVVNVLDDYFGDIGIETGGNFLSLFDLGIQDKNELPFSNEILENSFVLPDLQSHYRSVSAITCNTYPDNLFKISDMYVKNQPDIITQNGANVLYVCLEEKIDVIQICYVVDQLGNTPVKMNCGDEEAKALTEVLQLILNSIFETN